MEAFDYATSLPNKASKRSWMYWNISGPNSPRATYWIHHCSLPNQSQHPRIRTQKYQASPMDTATMDYKFMWLPPDDTRSSPPQGPLDNTPNLKQWPSPDGRFSSSRIYNQNTQQLLNVFASYNTGWDHQSCQFHLLHAVFKQSTITPTLSSISQSKYQWPMQPNPTNPAWIVQEGLRMSLVFILLTCWMSPRLSQ